MPPALVRQLKMIALVLAYRFGHIRPVYCFDPQTEKPIPGRSRAKIDASVETHFGLPNDIFGEGRARFVEVESALSGIES